MPFFDHIGMLPKSLFDTDMSGERSLCCVYTVSLFDTGMSGERSLCCVYTVSLFDTGMSGERSLCCVYTVSLFDRYEWWEISMLCLYCVYLTQVWEITMLCLYCVFWWCPVLSLLIGNDSVTGLCVLGRVFDPTIMEIIYVFLFWYLLDGSNPLLTCFYHIHLVLKWTNEIYI